MLIVRTDGIGTVGWIRANAGSVKAPNWMLENHSLIVAFTQPLGFDAVVANRLFFSALYAALSTCYLKVSRTEYTQMANNALRQPVLVLFFAERVAIRAALDVFGWFGPSGRPSCESGGLADIVTLICKIGPLELQDNPVDQCQLVYLLFLKENLAQIQARKKNPGAKQIYGAESMLEQVRDE